MSIKLSDYVFQFIADQGVKHVFMVPGGGAMHLNDSLGKREDIEFVCNLHEQASTIAAEAYARVTNNLGVALVTSGPGGTNAITGVAGAWFESTPSLIISGQVKRSDLKGDLGVRQLGVQEADIVKIVNSVTKYAVTILDPLSIRYHLEKAVALAKAGRKGPVWVDIPLDVQAAQIDPETLRSFEPTELGATHRQGASLASEVAAAIALLNDAERPVLLIGNGVRLAGAQELLSEVVNVLDVPVLTTWMGLDLFADTDPHFFGKPGTVAARSANFIVQNADCVIAIGARLDYAVTGFDQSQFARGATKVVVDVDPAELRKLRMYVHAPICSDACDFMEELLRQKASIAAKSRAAWLARCTQWTAKYPVVRPEYWSQERFTNVYVFASVLSEELGSEDLLIPGSSGADIDKFWLAYRVKGGQRLFSTGGLGAMGFGIPASIGGCLASGRKRTISVDGDGGFQLNIQELETVARLRLPIKFFVINNQGYASIRSSQRVHFAGHLVACDPSSGLTLPDTLRIADAYRIQATRINGHQNLREGIRNVLNSPGPIICEVMADPNQVVEPRVSSHVRADGSIVSRPLEDMWPFLDRDELAENMLVPMLSESQAE